MPWPERCAVAVLKTRNACRNTQSDRQPLSRLLRDEGTRRGQNISVAAATTNRRPSVDDDAAIAANGNSVAGPSSREAAVRMRSLDFPRDSSEGRWWQEAPRNGIYRTQTYFLSSAAHEAGERDLKPFAAAGAGRDESELSIEQHDRAVALQR